eukprot:2602519-Alexandrium_andersonii.AAC.1
MSASLVGSEMCIRDRMAMFGPSLASLLRVAGSRPPRSVVKGHAKWTDAVSYTHLTLPTICSV